jgi:pantoate kinase
MSFKAFSPAGISSFFEICNQTADGRLLTDPEKIGARGGGFVIEKGVLTEVEIAPRKKSSEIEVIINEEQAPEAETTRSVVRKLLQEANSTFEITVKHTVQVPIGAGFGTSAAGALGTALALSKALGLNHTYNDLGKIAHAAEVKCKTGLGTVGPLMIGGCVLSVVPGGPGTAVIDRIPLTSDYAIVIGVCGGISTKSILTSPKKREVVNRSGRKTLKRILSNPTLDNFLNCCKGFAEEAGFMNDRLRNLAELAERAGAIGAAQNMVGEAIHAVTTLENAGKVTQAFMEALPQEKIIMSKIDFQGARLLG